jgi:hypothetical protein
MPHDDTASAVDHARRVISGGSGEDHAVPYWDPAIEHGSDTLSNPLFLCSA